MIFIVIIVCFFLWMLMEAGSLQPEYISFNEGRLGIRAAFLSDIHIGLLMVPAKDIKKSLKEANPDLLFISGDLIEKPSDAGKFIKWLKSLNLKIPVYITLGNHDHLCFKKNASAKDIFLFNLNNKDIQLLINESRTFVKNGRIINIVGVDDYKRGNPNPHLALKHIDKDADFTFALSHNPEIALTFPEGRADLLLCGHFHGGQIWLPFKLEYRLLRDEETCRAGCQKGLHLINGNRTYISRGLGNVLVPLRLGSVPEITYIDI